MARNLRKKIKAAEALRRSQEAADSEQEGAEVSFPFLFCHCFIF